MLRRYFVTRPAFSPTQRLFTLLVESGMVYCALWVGLSVSQSRLKDETEKVEANL